MKTPVLDAMCDEFDLKLMTTESRSQGTESSYRWEARLGTEEPGLVYAYAATRKAAIRKLEAEVAEKLRKAAEAL